jgi:hypothetical protein
MNQNNNNMSYIKVQSEEIIFSEYDDRHILIKKENNEIIGLNYCQGEDLEYFVDNFMDIDHDLTDFFIAIKNNFNGLEEYELINKVIWAHFEYKNLRDERKAL